jgi:tRNA-specific 2-thiouridylase
LTQEQLAHTLFPVGGMEKPEVRKLAEKFGLPTASKKDSQGLCFIGKIDVKEFLKSFIKTKPGKVLDENGKVIGDHDGATFFTLGERHGFTIRSRVTGEKSAYYVISKDIQKNTITVSHKLPEGGLANAVTEVIIKDSNWTSGKPLSSGKVYYARARYRQALQKARIVNYESRVMDEATHQKNNSSIIHNSKFIIRFASAQSSVTPGQSIVLYDGEFCLGGGIIS